jgi:hypothetical protein
MHEFNAYQGYQEEHSFKEDDYILKQQIDVVNFYINDTNRRFKPLASQHGVQKQVSKNILCFTTNAMFVKMTVLLLHVHKHACIIHVDNPKI